MNVLLHGVFHKKLAENQAELAFTYLGDALKKRVVPLAQSLNSDFTLSCNVENKEEIIKLFEDIKAKWGQIDFVVHADCLSLINRNCQVNILTLHEIIF